MSIQEHVNSEVTATEPKPAVEKSPNMLETRYPAIFILRRLPEVNSVEASENDDGTLRVIIDSNDGYVLVYSLRQPTIADFSGDQRRFQAASKKKRLVMSGMMMCRDGKPIDVMQEVRDAEKDFPQRKPLTVFIETQNADAILLIPADLMKADIQPDKKPSDAIADQLVRDWLAFDSNEDQSINAVDPVRASTCVYLPVGTMSLSTLCHEVGHLFDDTLRSEKASNDIFAVTLDGFEQKEAAIREEIDEIYRGFFNQGSEPSQDQQLWYEEQQETLHQMAEEKLRMLDEKYLYDSTNRVLGEQLANEFMFNKIGAWFSVLKISSEQTNKLRICREYGLFTYQKLLEERRRAHPGSKVIPRANYINLTKEMREFYENIHMRIEVIKLAAKPSLA